jgi:pyruvate kinase
MNASAIVVFTATGFSARLVARYRPPVPIYAFTPSEAVARQLSLIYGIRPVVGPEPANSDEMVQIMDRTLVDRGLLKAGDSVTFVAGQPIGRPGTTNLMTLHRIGDLW